MAEEKEIKLPPKESFIRRTRFTNFMTNIFGFRRNSKSNIGLDFVQVDVDNDSQKIGQAMLDNLPSLKKPLGERLEKLFDAWLTDTSTKSENIGDRTERVNQLLFSYRNDPLINRTVELYADEATQLDDQNTLIQIETPDPRMTKDMYDLLNQWGVTSSRVRSTFTQIGLYGDGFWSNKITENGVESIRPLQQLNVKDRIEFNPAKVAEERSRKSGFFTTFASNNFLIQQMLDNIAEKGNLTDIFDTKLFGYQLADDLVVPPWAITHFRFNPEMSEFYPFGTSPILGALSSSKQTQSSIALQALARVSSFPITTFEVKTDENMDEGRQFAMVDRVREAFDNIGVNPDNGSSEVYSINTKVWFPKDLVTVNTVGGKGEGASQDTDDIILYQDREALALCLPRGFVGGSDKGGSFYGSPETASGKALVQQYKPFGRRIHSIQSCFLEGLSDLFRIHFAITGQYDFRTPFTLSLRYPAQENSSERNEELKSSVELIDGIVNLIKTTIGVGEDETLPPEIVRDIISRYSFLDASDIMKWTKYAQAKTAEDFISAENKEETSIEGESAAEGSEEGVEEPGEEESEEEGITLEDFPALEKIKKRENRLREKKLVEKYQKKQNTIYFKFLEKLSCSDLTGGGRHIYVSNKPSECNSLLLETLSKNSSSHRLQD